jgi:hypothetical protein
MRTLWLSLAVVTVTALSQPAQAQDAAAPLELKMYPVSDIVLQVADYPYGGAAPQFGTGIMGGFGGSGGMGGMGGGGLGGGGGAFQIGGDPGGRAEAGGNFSTAVTVFELVEALQTFVDPESWNEAAELQVLGGALVVKQTAENHERIGAFLKELRNSLGNRRTVSIDARWLLLGSDELEALIDSKESTSTPLIANRDQIKQRMGATSSLRAITHCFSGQKVYVVSGSKQNVVSGYIPVVGELQLDEVETPVVQRDGRVRATTVQMRMGGGNGTQVGYQPIVERPNLGVLLELRPTLVGNDDKWAIVDLKSTLSFSDANVALPPDVDPQGLAPQVDRLKIDTSELATTLRLPLGKPVIIGGLTQRPNKAADPTLEEGHEQEARQMYLILEVR